LKPDPSAGYQFHGRFPSELSAHRCNFVSRPFNFISNTILITSDGSEMGRGLAGCPSSRD
jgi:hypothetical protein